MWGNSIIVIYCFIEIKTIKLLYENLNFNIDGYVLTGILYKVKLVHVVWGISEEESLRLINK